MPDYEKLLKLLGEFEQKKLLEEAESQIESYNELIKLSLCKTEHDQQPCYTTDKGEPWCAQTLDALSLLAMAMDNLREGKYLPATKGPNALVEQTEIMNKPLQAQQEFAFKAVKLAIGNCIKCFPMLCRINLYQQIYRPCYQLYAQKKCTDYHLGLSPAELIEITVEKRLLNPSVCFPRPDDTKKNLKAFIYQHIKGSAQDYSKSARENVENIDSLDIGTGSTELLVILQDLLEAIENEIDSIPNQPMRERVQKLFDALKNGEIDFKDTDQENAQQLGITPRQYKFCRDQYFKPIVQSLMTHEEFKELSVKMTEIHIEPNNEND
jgi:hypothetical protein